MSEMKSRWYYLKNDVNCSNGGIKYKLSALLQISYSTEITYICIHVKALGTDFQLPSKMGAHWAKM